MTRILQLVTRDEPGGVQVLADLVQAGLRGRGYNVETMSLRGDGQTPMRVAKRILRGRFDAILSYQVAAGAIGNLVGAWAGTPVRVVHLTAIPSAMRLHWRLLDRLFGMVGMHTAIVANSAATAGTLVRYPQAYRNRMVLIGHGVAPLPVPEGAGWRERLGLPALAPMLVASGRLVGQKDHLTAIRAMPLLPTAHLAIAGDGPLRVHLLAEANRLGLADRLHLVGNLDRSQLAELLAEADVYVFPSVWESFGLAGAEAAMLGLPIVASDLAVLREVLAVPKAIGLARFHPPGNYAALAQLVSASLENYPTAMTRQQAALFAQAAHSVDTMIEAYCRLIAR